MGQKDPSRITIQTIDKTMVKPWGVVRNWELEWGIVFVTALDQAIPDT